MFPTGLVAAYPYPDGREPERSFSMGSSTSSTTSLGDDDDDDDSFVGTYNNNNNNTSNNNHHRYHNNNNPTRTTATRRATMSSSSSSHSSTATTTPPSSPDRWSVNGSSTSSSCSQRRIANAKCSKRLRRGSHLLMPQPQQQQTQQQNQRRYYQKHVITFLLLLVVTVGLNMRLGTVSSRLMSHNSLSWTIMMMNGPPFGQRMDLPPIAPPPPIGLGTPQVAVSAAPSPRPQRCAINLYGLPRNFKDSVLPSLRRHVVDVNRHYHCDYFVHFFNKTGEARGRSGKGGEIHPLDVYLLSQVVAEASPPVVFGKAKESIDETETTEGTNIPKPGTDSWRSKVTYITDTDDDFFMERREILEEIFFYNETKHDGNTNSTTRSNDTTSTSSSDVTDKESSRVPNPFLTPLFDGQTTINILKMWHSQTMVWESMEEYAAEHHIQYTRVAMLRLDVIYMTPIDIYRVPYNPIQPVKERDPKIRVPYPLPPPQTGLDQSEVPPQLEYFYDRTNQHAFIPGFAAYPVNDRFIAGPYDAVKVWATGRWDRAWNHVHNILPGLHMSKFGLHDEKLLAYSLLPAIMGQEIPPLEQNINTTSDEEPSNEEKATMTFTAAATAVTPSTHKFTIHVDNDLYFLRVRADGSIWILDSPHIIDPDHDKRSRNVEKAKLVRILGRNCTQAVKGPRNPSTGRWLIRCPPGLEEEIQEEEEIDPTMVVVVGQEPSVTPPSTVHEPISSVLSSKDEEPAAIATLAVNSSELLSSASLNSSASTSASAAERIGNMTTTTETVPHRLT